MSASTTTLPRTKRERDVFGVGYYDGFHKVPRAPANAVKRTKRQADLYALGYETGMAARARLPGLK